MKNNLENLRSYVCALEPKVNKLLRNNQDASELTFDELFKASSEPQTLFRVLNNKHIDTQNNLFSDKAYLSCSKDISTKSIDILLNPNRFSFNTNLFFCKYGLAILTKL